MDYYFERNNLLSLRKVQIPGTKPQNKIDWNLYRKAIGLVRRNVYMSGVIMPIFIIPIMEWRGNCNVQYIPNPLNERKKFLIQILRYLFAGIVSEILFYSSHRIFHEIKFLYSFHKVHHQFYNTFGIAASASHPIEHIISNLGTVFGTPIILGLDFKFFFIYIWLASLATTYGHSGYDNRLKLNYYSNTIKLKEFKFKNSPTGIPHDFHHQYQNCEFGSGYFDFMDSLLKTRVKDIYPKRWNNVKNVFKNE